MKLSWSIATRRRKFDRAMRRIQPFFESLLTEFSSASLQNSIHEAILVGITDDKDDEFFEEISNPDGFFQVLIGFDASTPLDPQNDSSIKQTIFAKLKKAVIACPLTHTDRKAFECLMDRWAEKYLRS